MRRWAPGRPDVLSMTSCFAVVQTLTPLTLELGGKSPAFVDAGHDTWNGIDNGSLELFLEEATEAPFLLQPPF